MENYDYLCIRNKNIKVYIMTTFNITSDIYEAIAEVCNGRTFYWDCIELENGYAVTFACKNGKPYDIEVRDENDDVVAYN